MNWILVYGLIASFMLGMGIYVIYLAAQSWLTSNKLIFELAEQNTGQSLNNFNQNKKKIKEELNITPRTTNCLALPPHGAIRHIKGGYIRGYIVELEESILKSTDFVEQLYDRIGQLIGCEKPEGTVIQFRFANHRDFGNSIEAHRKAQGNYEETYAPARVLHEFDLQHYEQQTMLGSYSNPKLSLWVYVPAKHDDDKIYSGFGAFISELKKRGIRGGWEGVKEAFASSNDGIVRRYAEAEEECYQSAEKVFRLIENSSPLRLRRLTREETWEALYYGHNENASNLPHLPSSPIGEIDYYLCSESIEGDNTDYLLHGKTPVAIVSLFAPPEPGGRAGILRCLTSNPSLTMRFTVVSEFVQLSKQKATKNLKVKKAAIEKTSIKATGAKKMSEEKERAYVELKKVLSDLTDSGENLTRLRFYVIVYGDQVRTQAELKESLKQLEMNCEKIITTVRKSMNGADAAREEPASLQALYEHSLIGEMEPKLETGREIDEVASSLCTLIPAESSWGGTPNPHTLVSTIGGRLIGINLFKNKYTNSPLVSVIAGSGGGKSVLLAKIVNDVLSSMRFAQVRVVDFGESLRPLAELIGGRDIRFVPGEVRAINIWDYDGIEDGKMPDEEQITLVVDDALRLSRTNPNTDTGKIRESILTTCVKEVYADEVPYNKPGYSKHEPTHTNLVNKLRNYNFPGHQKEHAENLALLLEQYCGHPWLDAPTHESYSVTSPLDVFELDSLDKFSRDIRESLAYRVAVRVLRSMGQKVNGELTPTLLVFDEMKKIADNYPCIMDAIRKGARQGRKSNVVTILATQAYSDVELIHDITSNAGCKIVGIQNEDFTQMVSDFNWPDTAASSIAAISNVQGSHAQYVMSLGAGEDRQIEMIQVDLSSLSLWTFTSDPVERNARAKVARLMPHWTTPDVLIWLATNYPRGLIFAGLTTIDESRLPQDELAVTQKRLALPEWREETTDHSEETEELLAENSLSNINYEVIEGEYAGEALGDEILAKLSTIFLIGDSQDDIERGKQEAKDMGIDIEGVFIVRDANENVGEKSGREQ